MPRTRRRLLFLLCGLLVMIGIAARLWSVELVSGLFEATAAVLATGMVIMEKWSPSAPATPVEGAAGAGAEAPSPARRARRRRARQATTFTAPIVLALAMLAASLATVATIFLGSDDQGGAPLAADQGGAPPAGGPATPPAKPGECPALAPPPGGIQLRITSVRPGDTVVAGAMLEGTAKAPAGTALFVYAYQMSHDAWWSMGRVEKPTNRWRHRMDGLRNADVQGAYPSCVAVVAVPDPTRVAGTDAVNRTAKNGYVKTLPADARGVLVPVTVMQPA